MTLFVAWLLGALAASVAREWLVARRRARESPLGRLAPPAVETRKSLPSGPPLSTLRIRASDQRLVHVCSCGCGKMTDTVDAATGESVCSRFY